MIKKRCLLNKVFIHITYAISLLILIVSDSVLMAQQSEITFENTPLDEVIQTIEDGVDLIFNYDPKILQAYNYTGILDLSDPDMCIAQVLYDTPFDYTKDALAILIYQTQAKDYQLCGTVKDAGNKELLIGVNISAKNTFKGTQTNQSGYFELSISAYKNQKITLSYIGYKSIDLQIQDIRDNDCVDIELTLDEELWSEKITITDYILDGISEENNYNRYVMDYTRLSKHHSIVEHDILKTSQLLPGITSIDDSATNLQIRGSTADQNLILWEGVPIYQSGHLFGMISAINPFSIDKVDIHKGVYDPKYDNRVGGIIDISMTDSIKTTLHGSIGMTLTEAHFNAEAPIIRDKLSILVSGRQSINTLINSTPLKNYTDKVFQFSIIDDQIEEVEEGFINGDRELNFYDWSTKVLFRPIAKVSVDVGIFKNNQDFNYKISFEDDPFNSTESIVSGSEAINANINWDMSTSWKSSLSCIQSKYESEYSYEEEELGEILADNVQTNDILDQSIVLSNSFNTAELQISAGYDFNIKRVNYSLKKDNIYDPYFEEDNFEQGHFHNVFASTNWQKGPVILSGGVRTSYYTEQQKWVVSPRFSLQYKASKQLKLKGEGGIFHQFISQLRDNGGNNFIVENPLWTLNTSNSNLSQKSNKLALGFNYQENGWLIDVEGYYNKTEGLSTLSPVLSSLNENSFSEGRSEAIGLDFLVKKRWTNFNAWINYSLGEITYLFPEILDKPFASPNDIRHNLSVVYSYTLKDFQFALIGNFHSGLPYSSPVGVETIYYPEENETFYSVDYRSINQDRLIPYMRLDLSINYRPTYTLFGHTKFELSLSVLNILNRNNVFAREYYLENNETSEVPDLRFIKKSLLPITPLVMCRIYW